MAAFASGRSEQALPTGSVRRTRDLCQIGARVVDNILIVSVEVILGIRAALPPTLVTGVPVGVKNHPLIPKVFLIRFFRLVFGRPRGLVFS
ncbi:hypothetical protein EYF80_017586 [Liparis tanakae]|uniref:Uncharacterized protein n=1 Tax=Liparis tanakae TaxID=230148 RepID=A0A4Z2I2J7_9TELE|nr:hypothetical protein EYF80_017586 [Liparis tanakae]